MEAQEDILIVDDNPANLRLLSQMLLGSGYNVRAVKGGGRALESIRALPPSLILLDIRMPEMDGYEVCERLKADENTQDIPVIFISALDEIQDKVKAFEIGGVDYITKPFQLEEVLVRTQTHLALRKLQKQLQETNDKLARELDLAGNVQTSFMPRNLPEIPGWQFSVELKPARETSGDFFDINQLPNGEMVILVADVLDKGVGAALFMALSWALFRTYAEELSTQPEKVFSEVNRHILEDTHAKQFVTSFFGLLNPTNGELVYCNAGQTPPILMRSEGENQHELLMNTGPPLGLFEDQVWERRSVTVQPGDVLVLYTDGITEAQNPQGGFFSVERLVESVKKSARDSAQDIQNNIFYEVDRFVGQSAQDDDIALIVITRADM
jgi:serine phosphatase RsbU (regulator of sigma subunit)